MITIVESPYAANNGRTVADHVKYALDCCRDAVTRNETPFASHLIYPQFLDDRKPHERLQGIGMGYTVARQCLKYNEGLIAFYTDYGWSFGMREAYAHYAPRGYKIECRAIYGVPVAMPEPFVMQLGC